MAEFRKATRTQESNVLNLKLMISRCEIADTLVTLLYARQRSVALLELCSMLRAAYCAARDTLRGTFREAQNVGCCAMQFVAHCAATKTIARKAPA
jgi:hypothetical protein